MKKLLFLTFSLIILSSCQLIRNITTDEERIEPSFKQNENEFHLVEEFILDGIKISSTVRDVEIQFGKPSEVINREKGYYEYIYDEQGLSFAFSSDNHQVKAYGIENEKYKTDEGNGIGSSFSDIVVEFLNYDHRFQQNIFLAAYDANYVVTFNFSENEKANFILVSDKRFFEKTNGMKFNEFLIQIEEGNFVQRSQENEQYIEDEQQDVSNINNMTLEELKKHFIDYNDEYNEFGDFIEENENMISFSADRYFEAVDALYREDSYYTEKEINDFIKMGRNTILKYTEEVYQLKDIPPLGNDIYNYYVDTLKVFERLVSVSIEKIDENKYLKIKSLYEEGSLMIEETYKRMDELNRLASQASGQN